jgi:mTERF
MASQLHANPLSVSKVVAHSAIHCVSNVSGKLYIPASRGIAARTISEGSTSASLTANSAASAAVTTDLATLDQHGDIETDLATVDDVTEWFRLSYRTMYSRANVRSKVERAQGAMLAIDPSRQFLTLQRDILPKTQLLDALSPGLAWKVFSRYPEEFAHPDAEDYWKIMAALLYTTGFSPQEVSTLFRRHLCLFAHTVRDPVNVKLLFEWMRELGLGQPDVMRIINKTPLILQIGVETILKPRLAFIENEIKVDRQSALVAIKRHPELLCIDSAGLKERIEFLQHSLEDLTTEDISKMFAAQPSLFMLKTAERLAPAILFLREELGCEGPLLKRLVTQSGLLTRSPDTIRSRVNSLKDFGIELDSLREMLQKFPRILLYPLDEPKYQKKLQFLVEIAKCGPQDVVTFPQYLSYSLPERIAPRVVAVLALRQVDNIGGRGGGNGEGEIASLSSPAFPPLSPLAMKLDQFLRHYGLTLEEYEAVVSKWKESEEAERWL